MDQLATVKCGRHWPGFNSVCSMPPAPPFRR